MYSQTLIKKRLFFCSYPSGLYTIDKINKSIGKSLFSSFNKKECDEWIKNNI